MTKRFKRAVLDIETNGLINMLVDYTAKPMVLKDHARIWCIAIRDFDNFDDVVAISLQDCNREKLRELLKDTEELIFHNGIAYDMVMLFLFGILEYKVGYDLDDSDTIFGDQPVKFVDTLILSKLLRQDRLGGHSVEAWGRTLAVPKIDFHEFDAYSEEMVEYCKGDTLTQAYIYQALLDEMGGDAGWKQFDKAYRMELKLADLTVRQELRGFYFHTDRAHEAVEYFNNLLDELKAKVDPLLPPRPMNKGEQKDFIPPKVQFKKDGNLSAHMLRFVERTGSVFNEEDSTLTFNGDTYDLPLLQPLDVLLPGSIDNLDHLKAYLLDLGWDPLEWKERDLTKDSKKVKLQGEKLDATIMRYVDSTLNGPFKKYRLERLGVTENQLVAHLFAMKDKFSITVPVSPMIRVGTAKALCPNLEKLGEVASFAKEVTEYLTFKHRKNSIAGGKEDEDGSPLTGYLSQVREDHRISTPADTLGANGGRYKHRVVCNVPRVSSPGGEHLRGLFGCGPGRMQLGFDFASLEARIQGHFVIPYTDGEALAESLIAEKPNDCFDMRTEILTREGWKTYSDIKRDTLIAEWNIEDKSINYSPPEAIIYRRHTGSMIQLKGERLDFLVTPNHRIVVYNRSKGEYKTLLAYQLKDYVLNNPDTFIPANGYLNKSQTDIQENHYLNVLDKLDNVSVKDGVSVIQSFDKKVIEDLSLNEVTSGSSSRVLTKIKNGQTIYQTTIRSTPLNKDGFKVIPSEISTVDYDGFVWCVSVPSTYVIIRRNGKISVSGNCHTINANKLGISRDNAKSFSYA